jgi:hypothetical protein
MEMEEQNRLGEALADCIRVLVSQCSGMETVASDLFRTLLFNLRLEARVDGDRPAVLEVHQTATSTYNSRASGRDLASSGTGTTLTSVPQFPDLSWQVADIRLQADDAASKSLFVLGDTPLAHMGSWFADTSSAGKEFEVEVAHTWDVLLHSFDSDSTASNYAALSCLETLVADTDSPFLTRTLRGWAPKRSNSQNKNDGVAEVRTDSELGKMRADINHLRSQVEEMRSLLSFEKSSFHSSSLLGHRASFNVLGNRSTPRSMRKSLPRRFLSTMLCLGPGNVHNAARDVPRRP